MSGKERRLEGKRDGEGEGGDGRRGTRGDHARLPGLKGRRRGERKWGGDGGERLFEGPHGEGRGQKREPGDKQGCGPAAGWGLGRRGGQGAPPVLCPLWHLGG